MFVGPWILHFNKLLSSATSQLSVSAGDTNASSNVPRPPPQPGPVLPWERQMPRPGKGTRVGVCGLSLPPSTGSRQPDHCRSCEPALMPEPEEENVCLFLFHKNNFRNCSHFIALIFRRNYKKKQIVSVRNQVLMLQRWFRVLAAMNPWPVQLCFCGFMGEMKGSFIPSLTF